MDRREFLKSGAAAGVMTLLGPQGITQALAGGAAASLEEGFRAPPASARPHTWWHWMNGHVSAEGITADLEAMARVGIGGFQQFFVGTGIPKGPVDYLGAEWFVLMRHAIAEAGRLGLECQMHNCPGWSSTGGPWITPALSMQQVVWSETLVAGGAPVKVRLPQPFTRLDHYRDIRVLAFPSPVNERKPWHDGLRRVAVDGSDVDARPLLAGTGQGVTVRPTQGKPGTVLLEFAAPFSVRAILFYARVDSDATGGSGSSIGPVAVEASDDGMTFRKIATVGQVGGEVPGAAEFPAVSAKYFRLQFPKPSRVFQVGLTGGLRLRDWVAKANYGGPLSDAAQAQPARGDTDAAGDAIDPAAIVDLTRHMDADGSLAWTPPPGAWTILRIGHTTTARINKAAPTTGEGLECDKYSAQAFDFHFKRMFEQLLPFLAPLARRGQVGVLIDSYEVGMQNWTGTFLDDFKTSCSYDLAAWLPVMTGRIVGSVDATERVLWDLRRVQADLMADRYYGRCAALCRQHGFVSYTEPYNKGPFEQMQAGARMDVNMGEFWVRTLHFRHSIKLAASIQHVHGRPVVGAESFTGYPLYAKWQEHPYALKAAGDYMYTKGLNRIVFHRFAHQPHPTASPGMTMGQWGIHFDRTATWWEQGRAWLGYLARCQHLLQQGLFVADLLYYTSANAPGADLSVQDAPDPAPPRGYDFDYLDTEALLSRVAAGRDGIVLPDGMRYRVLVLPHRTGVTLAALRKLYALVKDGMVLAGEAPARIEGLSGFPDSEAEGLRLIAALWNGKSGERVVGNGRVFTGVALDEVLRRLGAAPDFGYTARAADAAIHHIHRRIDGADVYFVANARRRAEDIVCTFRVADRRPEFWDPVIGAMTPADVYEPVGGAMRVPVSLGPSGSVFIVFRQPVQATRLRALSVDGRLVASTRDFAVSKTGRHAGAVGSFTMSAWIKPETDVALPDDAATADMLRRFGPRSFVWYPAAGDALYGEGHAAAGMVAGRNGLAVYEGTQAGTAAVLTVVTPLSGWTHIALVYDDGVARLYVDGRLAGTGKRSARQVHPSLGEEGVAESAPYFEGELVGAQLAPSALSAGRLGQLAAAGRPADDGSAAMVTMSGNGWLFWHPGRYVAERADGTQLTRAVAAAAPVALDGPWTVSFPPGLGAPASITLAQLASLHRHPDPGVKHFSGTATYRTAFVLPAWRRNGDERLFLDLGQVDVVAEVVLNGRNLGILWVPPFRVDITDAARSGGNQLEVRVTNLWPNRLIGDEQVAPANAYGANGGIKAMPDWYVRGDPKPADGRVTFTTWKHYGKDAPLLESGLGGPVRLLAGSRQALVDHKKQTGQA